MVRSVNDLTNFDDEIDDIMESIMQNNIGVAPVHKTQPAARNSFINDQRSRRPVHRQDFKTHPTPKPLSKNIDYLDKIESKAKTQVNSHVHKRRNPINIEELRTSGKKNEAIKFNSRENFIEDNTQSVKHENYTEELYQNENSSDLVKDKSKINVKSKSRRVITALAITISFILIPAISLTILKQPILALLKPKSPFSQELVDKMKIPLYYPTKLSNGYKMEINSITQPENNIVLYAITNDSGKKINISIQKQPEDINLEPLYKNLSNSRDLKTKFSSAKIGDSDNMTISNIMTGQSWLIITTEKNTLNDSEFTNLINSLEF